MTIRFAVATCFALAGLGCSGKLDAGSDSPHGPLPVDERSAIIISNEGARDNWHGEYAMLLAATQRIELVGIIVNSSAGYPDIEVNVTGFRRMIQAARDSGMRHIPDASASVSPVLAKPASGVIEDTVANRSEGARLILAAAARYGGAVHPLAIATGGQLTDVADAYLMDPTLPQRAVVVSSLGNVVDGAVLSGSPNGNLDSWATTIVASRMRYVQVNGFYDQLLDVPESRTRELPQNPFGAFMTEKRAEILDLVFACDQVSVLSVALPWFAGDVTRMRLQPNDETLKLLPDPNGDVWHVASSQSERMRAEIWQMLTDPATYR